jgi:hypothetical protein
MKSDPALTQLRRKWCRAQREQKSSGLRGAASEILAVILLFVGMWRTFDASQFRSHSPRHESYFRSIMPPSICRTWPVVYVLTIKKTYADATSSSVPRRPRGLI